MLVIPAINCPDISCIKERLSIVRALGARWVQFDVSDGVFVEHKTWDAPGSLDMGGISFEAHLMVESPQDAAEEWLLAGASRIIFQTESDYDIAALKRLAEEYGARLMVSLCPDTPLNALSAVPNIKEVQILAVEPGPSGQNFVSGIMDKVKRLLELRPGVTIEIDGGVTPQVAREAKSLGIYSVAVGSYIFDSDDPENAYGELVSSKQQAASIKYQVSRDNDK